MILIQIFFFLFIVLLYAKNNEPYSHQAARILQPCVLEVIRCNAADPSNSVERGYNDSYWLSHDVPFIKLNQSSGLVLKAYRPTLFSKLRSVAGISDTMFIRSLDPDNLICLSSDSKSGAAFWRSADNQIVLKTIKHYELKNFLKVLDRFAAHMTSEEHSCISAILGIYRVRHGKYGQRRYFMIAKNVYASTSAFASHMQKYDLKGSTIGRSAKPPSTVMKDLDLLASNRKLNLGYARPIVLRILTRDAQFLMSCGFMDYSLLVAVEDRPSHHFRRFSNRLIYPISTSLYDRGKIVCLGGDDCIYHFGIIDFLQKYTIRKRLETMLKGVFYDWRKISCVDPRFYADRFLEFMVANTV